MLFQCLVMLVSSFKLQHKEFEVYVLVGSDSIKDPKCGKSTSRHGMNYCGVKDCEESELIHDLKERYLEKFDHLKNCQPTSLEKAFKGKISYI